jgi:MFS family permease
MLSAPLGVIFGYALTYIIMVYWTWRVSFVIQGVFFIVMGIVFMFVPSDYVEINKVQ